MNTAQLEILLSDTPAKALKQYEETQQLPEKLSELYCKYKWRSSLVGVLALIGIFFPIAAIAIGVEINNDRMFFVYMLAVILAIALIVGTALIFSCHTRYYEKHLINFLTAAEKGRITEAAFSRLDFERTQALIQDKLVSFARNVNQTEMRFNMVRKDEKFTEEEVANAGLAVLTARSQYNELLVNAMQFGLDNGDKNKHFGAAKAT